MEKGKVKWFDSKKGFGIIVYNSDKEIFVHHSEIKNNTKTKSYLIENEEVQYGIPNTPFFL